MVEVLVEIKVHILEFLVLVLQQYNQLVEALEEIEMELQEQMAVLEVEVGTHQVMVLEFLDKDMMALLLMVGLEEAEEERVPQVQQILAKA